MEIAREVGGMKPVVTYGKILSYHPKIGLEAPASAFNLNRAPDLHRALSLLSSDVWIPPSTAQGDTFPLGSSVSDVVSHPTVQVVNSAPACWLHDEHSLSFNIHSSGSQIQELNQLFSTSNGHFLEFRT
ncbi:hypothetical protein HPP92_026244 [Vanilla planifolia]|uniref:Uncharacterized protein n=1 Tax=Vanilla planifolia TaxID=51239 RepID=A0A835PGF1_VANPL|nr:hypothetical protein HPP92_026244 [Vanilla planifolia]